MSNTPYSFPFEAMFDPQRAQDYIIRAILSEIHTAELVEVLAVQPTNDRVGFVTVQPLILDVDTNQVVVSQSPAYNVPYLRVQGGVSAIILDPAVGDRGLAVYAQADITNIKTTLAPGPAATGRTFSSADGLYLGGFLNGAPTQYVKFLPAAGGIDIVSPSDIDLTAGGNINLQAGGAIGLKSTGNTTVQAAQFIINAPTVFNDAISSTSTTADSVQFATAIKAPDVITSKGSVIGHDHGGVQNGTGFTNTMNT